MYLLSHLGSSDTIKRRARPVFDVSTFARKHTVAFDALKIRLATNFDTPAQRMINQCFAEIGEARFVGRDDRWEQVTAHLNDWEYKRPAAELMRRWAGQ